MPKKPSLKEIYKGRPFHERVKHFEDGGYANYSGYVNYVGYGRNAAPPSAAEMNSLTGAVPGAAIGDEINATGVDTNYSQPIQATTSPALLGASGSSGSSGSSSGGTLGSLIKMLGGSSSAVNDATAIAGLLGAIGQYKQNASGTPSFNPPALFGGTSGSSSGSTSANTGYGPAGGYNYANYQGLTAGSPGTGYAPRTAVTPNIPNYYTYGQGPQASFFSSAPPQTTTPPIVQTKKTGGRVEKRAMGGMRPNVGLPPRPPVTRPNLPGMPTLGGRPGMMNTGMVPGRMTGMAEGGAASAGVVTENTSPLSQTLAANSRKTGQPGTRPYNSGGESRHVQGPGDGTSDSIPARLANGEYVIDAQTVAMLGNGDNGAGAKRLDEFRKNVRQHKGAALARGQMAPDAKPLEKYMGGK
jgi:hypothetical protein